ncbi:hypothetical protein I302_104770 [Kwoniella bestiolae CBS 10118]|uniref:Uncharacterized protein n=1 Tax=Kwoniella bestiolae CBS 10118 TaxID=1296100 RepID=A0AAJ8K7T0_9TREE
MSYKTNDTNVEEILAKRARTLLQEWTKLNLEAFAQWKYDYAQLHGLKPEDFMDSFHGPIAYATPSVMTAPITWRTKRTDLPKEYTKAVTAECSEERAEELKMQFLQDRDQNEEDIWKEFRDLEPRWKQRLEDNWRASVEEFMAVANLGIYGQSTQRALLLLPFPPTQAMVDTLASEMTMSDYELSCHVEKSRKPSDMEQFRNWWSGTSIDPADRQLHGFEVKGLFHLCNHIKWGVLRSSREELEQ